jgi:hypothetical protein
VRYLIFLQRMFLVFDRIIGMPVVAVNFDGTELCVSFWMCDREKSALTICKLAGANQA